MVTLQDFQNKVSEFSVLYTTDYNLQLAVCTLGIVEELGEFILALYYSKEKYLAEAADVIAYCCCVANLLEIQLEAPDIDTAENLFLSSGKVCGLVKRVYRDNLILDSKQLELIKHNLERVIGMVLKMSTYSSLDTLFDLICEKATRRIANNTLHGSGDNR